MEKFEENLRLLFAKKALNPSHSLELTQLIELNLKDSLEELLEHVYKKVLARAHRILIGQEEFAGSSVGYEGNFGDALDDGMEDRPVVVLKVMWQQALLFEY